MPHNENQSIGVFIDGGYYAKINEGFAGTKEVNLKGLLSFICRRIAQNNNIDRKHLYVTECHYYRGRWQYCRYVQTCRIVAQKIQRRAVLLSSRTEVPS